MRAKVNRLVSSGVDPARHVRVLAFTIVSWLPCLIIVPFAQAQTGAYVLNGGTANFPSLTENASGADQSGIFVYNAGTLTVGTVNVTTSGNASSVDNSSQYGFNAGILAGTSSGSNGKGTITITGSANSIVTNGNAANGLFATNSGSSISMNGGSITTTGPFAHGVDVTYGGAITLNNVNITTYGAGCLATDFGGGTVTATGGTMLAANTTLNSRVPGIYSTGTISVTGATVISLGDCGGVIDGANSILLTNTALSGMVEGIKIWKTAPASGSATVTINGGSVNTTSGAAFYVTGTTGNPATATITAKGGAVITPISGLILDANGSSVATFTANDAALNGGLYADNTSTITAALQSSTVLTGTANRAALTLDSSSAWYGMGGSLLTSLSNSGKIASKANSPGLLTISSSFSQSSSGLLDIDLGGTAAGTSYDELAVSGAARLGGTLEVDLIDGFTPTLGETFTILTRSSGSGAFSSIISSNPEVTYSATYNTGSVQLTATAVPEPAAGTLLSALAAAFAVCRVVRMSRLRCPK